MGGAGKTTLSKAFYNVKAFKYVKSCYLENVKSKGVQDVQKELLRGLCGEQLDQGKGVEKKHLDMIKDCFLTQKVLVVIDDVSSVESLHALHVFHALETGSKVVVTGRDSAILPHQYLDSGKAVIEPVDGIKDGKGSDLELFSQYAFAAVGEDVKTELHGEANKIVQLCNGLPLSLEVLGKYLGDNKCKDLRQWKEIWADAHARLQKAQSIDGNKDDKLWSSLRISYDHLGDPEQKMFLDFACIFSEMKYVEKRLFERIWGSLIGVQNLVNKSLLKVQDGDFVMHEQLRDMGRHMLLKEVLKDYQQPIYLWHGYEYHSKTYMDFKKLTTELGVPYVASVEHEVGKSLHQYSKLKLFIVIGCNIPSLVDDCLSQCSRDLRWLHLKSCLGVTQIGIQKLCPFGDLRVLQIRNCDNIVELPEDIGKLINLVEIEVVGCKNLQSLPDNIGKLKKLKRLVIERSGLRVVPDSVGELPEVEYLSFEGCDELTVIGGTQICTKNLMELWLPIVPTTCLRPCPQLRRLVIANGRGVKEFPRDFFKIDMPKLEVVTWMNHSVDYHSVDYRSVDYHSVDVVLENPDGTQLVLENKPNEAGCDLEVRRHSDGSISRFSVVKNNGSVFIQKKILRLTRLLRALR